MEQRYIRNFCIIAHIDHGKSTLADRLLELTGAIAPRQMTEQVLDQMDLERERGITIKAKALRLTYRAASGQEYELHLIDTPGHVDFSYEVSRSLAACEGAILVVDASQGIQAQTLAHVSVARELGLTLIPVINKIDLPNAEPQRVALELVEAFSFAEGDIIFASAKEGTGTRDILEAVVARVPAPSGQPDRSLRALVFDSKYDPYKGVIAYLRVVDGRVAAGQRLRFMATGRTLEALEVGIMRPAPVPQAGLEAGEVGYVATGLKEVRECPVGDTLTLESSPGGEPLLGYRAFKPMVFAGLYPAEGQDYSSLREALDKLRLNDASFSYEPETSQALGFGFRCGFLGLLHMEIVQERLEREYGLNLLFTAPSVSYQVVKRDGRLVMVENPAHLPAPNDIQEVREPWMSVTLVTPQRFVGNLMELTSSRRGEFLRMEYLEAGAPAQARVLLEYRLPLSQLLRDFYDQLKSRSQGFATLDYIFHEYRPSPLVKLDILVNNVPVDALSFIVHREEAQDHGRALAERLRELIPRQLFEVAIQAAIGGKVIARETVRALRKDVLAKCYGGDITRKRKLLEKQAEGKKRLKRLGNVEIPQEAFVAVLKLEKK